jgi:hypothetical protein
LVASLVAGRSSDDPARLSAFVAEAARGGSTGLGTLERCAFPPALVNFHIDDDSGTKDILAQPLAGQKKLRD